MTPRGALRLNPQIISDNIERDFEEVKPPEQVRLGRTHPVTEKDGYSSSVAATEPDMKHEIPSPTIPTIPTIRTSTTSTTRPVAGIFNSPVREWQSEWQQPVLETRVHMPTGIRVDLNVSARALPHPPHPLHSPVSPGSPIVARTHF